MVGIGEAVTEAADGTEVVSGGAEFATDSADLGVHGAHTYPLARLPEPLKKPLAGTHLAPVPRQFRQQPELGDREEDFLAAHGHLAGIGVKAQEADAGNAARSWPDPHLPDDGADAQQNLPGVAGRGDHIINPGLQKPLPSRGVGRRREDQYGQVRFRELVSQLRAAVFRRTVGEQGFRDQGVGPAVPQERQGLPPGRQRFEVVASRAKLRFETGTDVRGGSEEHHQSLRLAAAGRCGLNPHRMRRLPGLDRDR